MLSISDSKKFTKEIIVNLLKLVVAGVVIGVGKKYDLLIAILLVFKIIYELRKSSKNQKGINKLVLFGMLLTGFGGIVGETWGVLNGYWEYHFVPRKIPFWVPFAWMLAFNYLYKLEKNLIPLLEKPTTKNKIVLAIILALVFPAVGEMITIYLGVWTYYWPYQVFGVPLYAFLCLVFVHMLVYFILNQYCKKQGIQDIVYN